jgi:gamma-glutamyltranspeptidase/glutathione hydrolase
MFTAAKLSPAVEPEGRTQARSMVITRQGIVAAEQPLAAQAGASILAQGGNAIDAAVAANAVMGVVEPMCDGIGGDMFALIFEAKTGKLYGLNASGWAPAALTAEFMRSKGYKKMPEYEIYAATVPGTVDGWDKLLKRFGRKRMSEVLAPAIRYAEQGFPVTELIAQDWADGERKLRKDANAAATYLPNGRPPGVGEVFRNPDLAWSLKQIAAHGRKAFYEGAIAKKLLAYEKQMGGVMTAEDLATFSTEWVEPISTTYHGWTVYEIPPNGQGIGALMMLNLMENFPLAKFGPGSADAFHVMIEAKKLAYADMLRYVCDQKFHSVPVAGMLSKDYARERAKLIDLAHAKDGVEPGRPPGMGTDTTYLCTVDEEGNMVSYIQSNYANFGSGLVAGGTGFVLQNRGELFSLDANSPNVLAGHKRPLHTIIPAFASKDQVRIAFGIMGGWNQSQAHAQFVSDIVDHQMNIQAAMEAPRFVKHSFAGRDVELESRVPAPVQAALTARGHQIKVAGYFDDTCGGGQAVLRDFAAGVNYGASDPRKDGAAIPQLMGGK